ncbi:uncharacterized protein BDZ99DRAFT_470104 [Mytilinidion resinicola]|uniref:Uncharacterized protein n=1 Tax=Mytilinidion resinicola TaxID=574789 RepID=A0A6A6Z7R1_9PEZI|nr:uncharacterized protein BDZ99DRAFT_470104 [Mytilinidion resinicola]KAF2817040.1 hypothetical protein BDZ99DRAFT_470104 [Mytilinidion resinicola]
MPPAQTPARSTNTPGRPVARRCCTPQIIRAAVALWFAASNLTWPSLLAVPRLRDALSPPRLCTPASVQRSGARGQLQVRSCVTGLDDGWSYAPAPAAGSPPATVHHHSLSLIIPFLHVHFRIPLPSAVFSCCDRPKRSLCPRPVPMPSARSGPHEPLRPASSAFISTPHTVTSPAPSAIVDSGSRSTCGVGRGVTSLAGPTPGFNTMDLGSSSPHQGQGVHGPVSSPVAIRWLGAVRTVGLHMHPLPSIITQRPISLLTRAWPLRAQRPLRANLSSCQHKCFSLCNNGAWSPEPSPCDWVSYWHILSVAHAATTASSYCNVGDHPIASTRPACSNLTCDVLSGTSSGEAGCRAGTDSAHWHSRSPEPIRTQSGTTAPSLCRPGHRSPSFSSSPTSRKASNRGFLAFGKSCCTCTLFRMHRRYRSSVDCVDIGPLSRKTTHHHSFQC